MKNIKFRMWNGHIKMIYDIGQVSECLKQQIYYESDPKSKLGYNHLEDGSCFMVFIGLQDKNKKEVYEGDIIQAEYEFDGKHFKPKAIIEWDECEAWFFYRVIDDEDWLDDWELGDIHRFEVIGNIFENKNLLPDDQ